MAPALPQFRAYTPSAGVLRNQSARQYHGAMAPALPQFRACVPPAGTPRLYPARQCHASLPFRAYSWPWRSSLTISGTISRAR
jgi:hypothetical protein